MFQRYSSSAIMKLYLLFFVLDTLLVFSGQALNPGCECIRYSGTYGKDYGRFSTPDFPKPYPKHIDCLLYTFIAGPHEIIEINFTNFELYNHRNDCTMGDYLKMYLHLEKPEVNELSKWNGLLCNNLSSIPRQMFSSGPVLIMELHTAPAAHNSTGFDGTFRFIDKSKFKNSGQKLPGTTCDYQFVSTNNGSSLGYFYSPMYPSIYPKNIKCHYRFRARSRQRIRILFEEVNLQPGDKSCLGREDSVKVYDGSNLRAPVITIICHFMKNVEVISSLQSLYVEFQSGLSNWPGNGFRAKYFFQTLPAQPANYLSSIKADVGPAVSATRSGCDRLIRSDSGKEGILTSPKFPLKYPSNTVCKYKFEGSGRERIQLIFQQFTLSNGENGSLVCENKDTLEIYMRIDGRLEKTNTFCGNEVPKPIMSNGPRLFVEFIGKTSPAINGGFKATYKFINNFGIKSGNQLLEFPCAFTFSMDDEHDGILHSPNFPGQYPRNTECHFLFHNHLGNSIKLLFSHFHLKGEPPCVPSATNDYIEYSTYVRGAIREKRMCGHLKPFHIEFNSRLFRLTFKSNNHEDGNGFNASYHVSHFTNEHSDNYASIGNSICNFYDW